MSYLPLMNFNRLLNLFKSKKQGVDEPKPDYPFYWEDDFLQVEIVSRQNKAYLLKELQAIQQFSNEHYTPQGFTDVYMRKDEGQLSTLSLQIRFDALDTLLTEYLHRATHIQYEATRIIDCSKSVTQAYRADGFTIFVDAPGEFVTYIWLRAGLVTSAPKFSNLLKVLYIMGETYNLALVDWNSLEYIDLTDKNRIEQYLHSWFK